VQELLADQQAGHGDAGQSALVPGQQILSHPPRGGSQKGINAELKVGAYLPGASRH
jgi:hypothetical protein